MIDFNSNIKKLEKECSILAAFIGLVVSKTVYVGVAFGHNGLA